MASLITMLMGLLGHGKAHAKEYELADVYRDLRQQVLIAPPEKIGFTPTADNKLWGLLMETGYPEAVVTLVAIADGTVSLYFSNGGGIIGIGEHENARKASNDLLAAAPKFIVQASLTKDFPLPSEGHARFYFLTSDGTYTVEAKEDDLGYNRSPLSSLFYKAQELITQARIVEQNREKGVRPQ